MPWHDSVHQAVRSFADRVRRDAIAYAICAVLALGVLILATWAAVLSLTPLAGAIYAPLIVAGIFLLAILATVLWLQLARARQSGPATPAYMSADAAQAQRQAQFAQIAMIIEAVMLGYSLSRRR